MDEYANAEAERLHERYERARHITGQDVPQRPSSQELVRRLIEKTLDLAGHVPGIDDRAQAALGRIGERLAIGAEMDHTLRQWLQSENAIADRALRDAYRNENERKETA